MLNILSQSKILKTNAFKFSTVLLLGTSTLLFNTSAVSQEAIFTHEHPVEQNNSQSKSGLGIASEKRQNALDNTKALTKALAHYLSAKDKSKANYLNQMVSLVKERQSLLSELAQADPASVSSVVITQKQRNEMPEEVQALLEQEQELEGELEVFYEDYEDHSKSRLRHVLKTATNRVELHLADNADGNKFQSGVKVRAHGWKLSDSDESTDPLFLGDEQNSLAVLADGSTATTTTSSSSSILTNTLGEQRTLVMLVNFQNNVQEPWTVDEVSQMVFGTVNDYYKEVSYGKTWLNGDVQGYFTLPIDEVCDLNEISTQVELAAKDNSIDTNSYSRLLYIFPSNSACGWTGRGTVGGSPSEAWINGSLSLRTVGHELGHNFGLYHAHKLECGSDVVTGDCYSVEYGDSLDIMGASGFTGHFNAFNKDLLGWLSNTSSTSSQIESADQDGSYILEPYESNTSGLAKSLKILRGIDTATGQKLWYFLEYRQPLGLDSYLSSYPGVTSGISFHLGTQGEANSSQLIDITPNSASADWSDFSLSPGKSYTDLDAGITITTEWADSTGASVHVSFTKAACTQANPVVSVSANQSAAVVAGSTVSYNVTVTNNDSSVCDSAVYDVSVTVPTGWSSTAATLEVAPGTSDTVTLKVTSSDTASEGTYDITFNAINSVDSSVSGNSVASYHVEAPAEECALANPSVSLSPNQSGEFAAGTTVSYTATVTSNDSSGCDTATFDVVAIVSDGWSSDTSTVTLAPGQSESVNLNVKSATTAEQGIYPVVAYTYNTADPAYNSSAEGSYTVAASELVCSESAPSLSVLSNSGDVTSGSTATYDVIVTNQNSTDCEAKTYTVFADVPSGWNSGSKSVFLASGDSTTVQLEVTSSATASDGTYGISIYAQDSADSSITSNAVVSYVIANPTNSAPIAVNDTVMLSSKDAILIDVLANDSDPDGDVLTVSAVTQGSKGSVEITSSGQLLYTPAKNFKGSDSFSYTISDGNAVTTATVNIGLADSGNSSGGGNKGKGNNK